MFRKLFAFIMALFIAVSVPVVSAQPADAEKETIPVETQKSDSGKTSYFAYSEKYADYKMLGEEIKVSAQWLIDDANFLKKEQDNTFINWNQDLEKISFEVEFSEDTLSQMSFLYKPEKGSGIDIELNILIDGKLPFSEAECIELKRRWTDSGNPRTDAMGNETSPVQAEISDWFTVFAKDSAGIVTEPLLFAFSKGKHTVTLERVNDEPFLLDSINFSATEEVSSYEEYANSFADNNKAAKQIIIEAENATSKSKKSLTAKADRSSVEITPNSYATDKLNYIGGSNWSEPDDTLNYEFEVMESGWYKLAFRYRQSYVLNGNSYRLLKIDGKVPFKEAKLIKFPYSTRWIMREFASDDNIPYEIYLEEGKHTLSLSVTLGAMADIYTALSEQIEVLGEVYRKMIMIMGTTPDANRDYDLFEQIKDLDKTLENSHKQLKKVSDMICALTGKKSDANTAVIDGMVDTLKKLLDNPYRTQKYKDDFYDNYCSLGAILSELTSMPLDIDSIMLLPENKDLDDFNSNMFEKMGFSVKRFMATFLNDYSNISSSTSEGNEKISIWLYWGKDQVQVLNNLIKEDFTPEHNIDVDIKITNASLVQALLSNNTPDLSLRLTGMDVMNIAMRGGLYNLCNFKDYSSVTERFAKTASIPYEYQGGTYAIPDMQVFNMLFYRKDILEEYNMTVPKTWDEFISISTFFFHNNLQVGMPNTFNTFATFLYQLDGSIYNKDKSRTVFSSKEFVDAFSLYTDFFVEYGFEVAYDFYNRFRTGEMPMAVADYSQYNVLKVSAPEIDGKWTMTLLPGTVDEKGEIDRTGVADGSGSCILSPSKKKDAAWEFLKWWTDTEAQIKFNNECESILGPSARLTSANIEATKGISWAREDLDNLVSQWEITNTIPETPGSYYTARMYQQAFWEVINDDANQRNTIVKWGKLANQEIERKRKEYNLE